MRTNWKKKCEQLSRLLFQKRYQIVREGDPNCNHSFDDYELTSDSGIAFCEWKCTKCGLVVAQTLRERIPPENVPLDKTSWTEE